MLYSVDPDPQARFWRTVGGIFRQGDKWSAPLPILSTDQLLFASANVHYKLDRPEEVPFARPTSSFALTSRFHTATPENLQQAEVKATDEPADLIEDFSSAWQDWYRLSADNPHHWQYWTRKISDPKWRGRTGNQLALEVRLDEPHELVVMPTEKFFRSYRGRQQEYLALVPLAGGDDSQSVTLSPSDFTTPDKQQPLESWAQVDLQGLRVVLPAAGERKDLWLQPLEAAPSLGFATCIGKETTTDPHLPVRTRSARGSWMTGRHRRSALFAIPPAGQSEQKKSGYRELLFQQVMMQRGIRPRKTHLAIVSRALDQRSGNQMV